MLKVALALVSVLALASATPSAFEPFPIPSGAYLEDVAFMPDGQTLFVTRADGLARAIVQSTLRNGVWSPPIPAAFSGRWRDIEEVLSPDGREMVFASNRPAQAGGKPIDGFYGGKRRVARGGNLWIVRWNGSRWGTPQRLPDAVNVNTSTFSPALARDGTLYYMRASGPGLHFHIFVAKRVNGTYAQSTLAPFSDIRYSEFDPTVAPDNSFVIFGSNRPPSPKGTSGLFISFNRNGTWTTPKDMGPAINPAGDAQEPRLSPDGKSLYYSSAADMMNPTVTPDPNATLRLWKADITPWL